MPSGGPSSPSAKTRRYESDPSPPTVNAVRRLPTDSATISVDPSGVMTIPFGKSRSCATTLTALSGSHPHDDAAFERLRADVGAAMRIDDHVADARGHDVGQVGDGVHALAVIAQQCAVLGGRRMHHTD